MLAARPPRGCVARSARGVTPSLRPWCVGGKVEILWFPIGEEKNNITYDIQSYYITLNINIIYLTLHSIPTWMVQCHSTFNLPWLFSVLGSAIYHSSAWQVSYIKYFMAWLSFSTSVKVPPESDISGSLNVFHHSHASPWIPNTKPWDKTGHNIMLLDINLRLKYVTCLKVSKLQPFKSRCIYNSHLNLKHHTSQEIIHVEIWMLETCPLEQSLKAFSWLDWRIISMFIRSWHVS